MSIIWMSHIQMVMNKCWIVSYHLSQLFINYTGFYLFWCAINFMFLWLVFQCWFWICNPFSLLDIFLFITLIFNIFTKWKLKNCLHIIMCVGESILNQLVILFRQELDFSKSVRQHLRLCYLTMNSVLVLSESSACSLFCKCSENEFM